MSINGPLKWHGGKSYLANRIVALFPKHRHYCEPFAGGLSVLLSRDPADESLWLGTDSSNAGVSEIVSDTNRELANFWTCLQHPTLFAELHRRLQCVPLSRWEWQDARAFLVANPIPALEKASLDHACAFFICCRQSLAGRQKNFTAITRNRTRRQMNGNVSEWLGAVDGLPEVHARLRTVIVENLDALTMIRREDTLGTLFYCDPPYLHETRATTTEYGAQEMSIERHHELCALLRQCKGKVLLSGYPSALYAAQLEDYGWKRTDFDLPNNAAGGAEKRRMVESLWRNF